MVMKFIRISVPVVFFVLAFCSCQRSVNNFADKKSSATQPDYSYAVEKNLNK